MLKVIVNCGPCDPYIQKCLDSLISQSFRDWEAFVTVDPCGDRTLEVASQCSVEDDRIHLHANSTRLFSMANLAAGIERSHARDQDIVVVLDGDDWFYSDHALQTIADTYDQSDCWMTYGSWISNKPGYRDRWPAYSDDVTDFRHTEWLGTAVRTWKRWLWDLIDPKDFRDEDGSYIRVGEDIAAMFPMLEMSGTARARHIPDVLMVYNRANPHCVGDVLEDESIRVSAYLRSKRPYQRLDARP